MFRRIQQQAAFIEFSLQNFDEARELFKSGQVDIREVLFVIMMFFCSSVVSSPEHEVLMVSYCGQSMSVVRRPSFVVRRASSVVRRAASTIALKAYSSYTPGPIDLILGRKHQGDL